ncbi:MAG: 4-hydroxy-tetrahydrodipicolinate synthase [Actinomycetota bacterium]|nr:4-hydroxy-tetrahydrodipicolinate synthase [Actinomycetota bacterium]
MTQGKFGQVITAMVTPFNPDGSLNLDGARKLAAHLVDNGSDGIFVTGTTGESPTLSHAEKLSLFSGIVEEVSGHAKVIAGTGTYNTSESVELTREAADKGVDACVVVTPYYSKPPQNGLVAHFAAIADASPVPLILYDIPGRTARRIERPTLLRLAQHERFVAVKDAVGDASETARLRSELDAGGMHDFDIYCGDDVMLMPHLAAGAVGVISVCSHIVGLQMKELFAAWYDGKVDEAQRLYLSLMPLFDTIMTVTTSPIGIKAACRILGLEVGDPRLPLVAATQEEVVVVRSALEQAGLI